MNRRPLYPLSTWLIGVLIIPLGFIVLGIIGISTINENDLIFDNARLWWLIAAIPLAGSVYLYGMWRKKQSIYRFTSDHLAPLLAGGLSPTRQAYRAGLLVLTVLMIVTAIIGPRWGIYLEKQKVFGIDIVVALDLSRSMLVEDVAPNRLEYAKQRIREQLTERAVLARSHRLALIGFAGSTTLRLPLTTDHLAFQNKLDGLYVGVVPRGGTAISDAIRRSVDLFSRSPEQATKIILLFTDGEDHEGNPIAEANIAWQEHDIRVFTIGVGDPARSAGAPVPGDGQTQQPMLYDGQIVFSKLDVTGLRKIAEMGQGQYVALDDLHQLIDAIASMKRSELTMEERIRRRPQYQWFVVAALILMLLETMIGERIPGREAEPLRIWQQEATS